MCHPPVLCQCNNNLLLLLLMFLFGPFLLKVLLRPLLQPDLSTCHHQARVRQGPGRGSHQQYFR